MHLRSEFTRRQPLIRLSLALKGINVSSGCSIGDGAEVKLRSGRP
jgi:hypothetical protein